MAKIDWAYVQAASDDILSDGFEALKSRPPLKLAGVLDDFPCNYLISLRGQARYAGEAQNAAKRLSQQFRETTSTFYKSYLKKTDGGPHAPISDFDVQVMRSDLGRKEIEEFGIVHMIAPLNKFRMAKRDKREAEAEAEERTGVWEVVQAQYEQLLEEGAAVAMQAAADDWFNCQPHAGPGLYLVRHQDRIVYVGESSDLAARHETHSEDTYFSALRRHIGTELLGFELQEVGGRKRHFTDDQDWKVTRFLTGCEAVFYPVSFGRFELEEKLIKAHLPVLNRRGMPA